MLVNCKAKITRILFFINQVSTIFLLRKSGGGESLPNCINLDVCTMPIYNANDANYNANDAKILLHGVEST
jgi:hypothetical protein